MGWKEDERDDSDSGSGQIGGGASGALEFKDFVLTGEKEKLSPQQEAQKLAEHKSKNSGLVDKQKALVDERAKMQDGKAVGYQAGAEASGDYLYKNHPILSKAAEFDGADDKVNWNPNDSRNEANNEKKLELVPQPEPTQQLRNQPKAAPPTLKPY